MSRERAAHVIVLSNDENDILLSQRKDVPMWVLPGGHLRRNETFRAAAKREYREETGLDVKVKENLVIYKDADRDIEKRLYKGVIVSGNLRQSRETKKAEWFPVGSLPMLTTLYERERIKDVLSYSGKVIKKKYEFDWKRELLFQISNPIRFGIFLYYYLRNKYGK
jgi:8-oxo-dGTP diphosphatase